jgi:thioredoxin 1
MESSIAHDHKIVILTIALVSLTLLTGCGAMKSLLGKRNATPTKKTMELTSRAAERSADDSNEVMQSGYQQDESRPEVALASANLSDDASVVQAAAQVQVESVSSHAFSGTVQHIGANDFEQQVLNSDVPVLVDFYADWCGPCKKLSPTLDRIASEASGARVVKVNIDDSPRIAKKYGVSSIPTVMVFKNGAAVARNTGLASQTRLMQMLTQ